MPHTDASDASDSTAAPATPDVTGSPEPTDRIARFTALSARLTGFDGADLVATGLVEAYLDLAAEELGAPLLARLLDDSRPADGDERFRDAARAVTYLWYTGSWPGRPPVPVSPRAYAEALAWKSAGLNAPATHPGGYGSWAGAEGGVR
ncbi:hypothetical protein [Streptomyces sp. NPDC048659]|uniref:hypothetical protein n=1 Tax=Streptomyces sp. NPDC048659 TaxID=3155489 RepID=UPI00343C136D